MQLSYHPFGVLGFTISMFFYNLVTPSGLKTFELYPEFDS